MINPLSIRTNKSSKPLNLDDNLYVKFTKKAFDVSIKLLQVSVVLIAISAILFWLSLFLHVTVINKWIPATDHNWPVFLQYNDCSGKHPENRHVERHEICSNPVGVVILDEKSIGSLSPPPMSSDFFNNNNGHERKHKYQQHQSEYSTSCGKKGCSNIESSNVFSRGQSYSATVQLKVPDSASNRELGMFQVGLSLHDKDGGFITGTKRAVRLPYRPLVHKLILDLMNIPFILFETGNTAFLAVDLPMVDSFVEDSIRPVHHMRVVIFSRTLEWDSCHVKFETQLSGLKYFMGNHPYISFIFSVAVNIFAFLFLAGLLFHYYKKSNRFNLTNFLGSLQQKMAIKQIPDEMVVESTLLEKSKDFEDMSQETTNVDKLDRIESFTEVDQNTEINQEDIYKESDENDDTKQKKKVIPDYMNEPSKYNSFGNDSPEPESINDTYSNASTLENELSVFALSQEDSLVRKRAVTKENLGDRELSPTTSDASNKSDDSFIVVRTGGNTPVEDLPPQL